ncbi:MAG: AtpZ/AtpI family protein [Saprospiraceae bacterium]
MNKNMGNANAYLKYAGMAFQFFGILAVGAFAGRYLDNKFQFDKPYLTLTLVLFIFAALIYRILVDTRNRTK